MEKVQFYTKSTRLEDNIPLYFQRLFDLFEKSIHYHPLTQSTTYDVLEPRNTSSLFYTLSGLLSSHNIFNGTSINPIVRNISQIVPPSLYTSLPHLFKKMYVIKIPDFSTPYYDFTSNTITFNNPNDNLMFSFQCYVSEDCNINSVEQLIVNENETQLLSQNFISKRLIQNEFGTLNIVGISINPGNKNRGKLKIRIHKTSGTGNKIFGRIIISEPVLFQYPGNRLLLPQFNNLYQYTLPMFGLFNSLQKGKESQKFTIMFVFIPLGSVTSDQLQFPLFSLGQENPSNRYEFDSIYTSKEFLSQSLIFNPITISGNYFDMINEQRTIKLSVKKSEINNTQIFENTVTINVKDFMYVPHLQVITYNDQVHKQDIHIYLNFNKRISVTGIPVYDIYNFQFSQFGNWLDFILGGVLNNKINQREFFIPVNTFQNFIFRDLIFIDNFYFNEPDFDFDKITIGDNVIRPILYKVIHD